GFAREDQLFRPSPVLVGVDTGGTITDLVAFVRGELRVLKIPSTPRDPAAAVLRGLDRLLGDSGRARLHYGSTMATNALLERRGARGGLLPPQGVEGGFGIGPAGPPPPFPVQPPGPPPPAPRRPPRGGPGRRVCRGRVSH